MAIIDIFTEKMWVAFALHFCNKNINYLEIPELEQWKIPYSSTIDILLSQKGLINWYMVVIQSQKVAPDSL